MLHKLDQEIIAALQEDGRRSNVDLARRLGVSESTVRKRIKSLVDGGVMRIAAILNPYKIGYGFISIMGLQVRLSDLKQVGDLLAKKPNVYYVTFVTGRYDLLITVIARTPEELSQFIKEHVSAIPGILRSETFVNLEVIKNPWTASINISDLLRDM